ncbi:hypothetical protein BCR44DRAFT_326595 [Catenaria anguillulae PL171]|uniref:Uncharacterized protein n=1 Tax=Catenaria anguillulae PL171 TaxID=765915 RepID=A0A1Y2H715_9FUNG|nr:hypothetical protein BCR44DRAFT_326595 [Catenaria anguillulae PL171]
MNAKSHNGTQVKREREVWVVGRNEEEQLNRENHARKKLRVYMNWMRIAIQTHTATVGRGQAVRFTFTMTSVVKEGRACLEGKGGYMPRRQAESESSRKGRRLMSRMPHTNTSTVSMKNDMGRLTLSLGRDSSFVNHWHPIPYRHRIMRAAPQFCGKTQTHRTNALAAAILVATKRSLSLNGCLQHFELAFLANGHQLDDVHRVQLFGTTLLATKRDPRREAWICCLRQ